MAALIYILIFSALTGYSSGTYCICKDGVGDQTLQKTLDYACGNGADCTAILQNGACYSPNTLKDHCSYAASSYYQKKISSQATCDFGGAATISPNPPSGLPSTCSFPSAGSTSTTPTSGTTPTMTPPTMTPPTMTPPTMTPPTGTSTGNSPMLTPPTGTTTGGGGTSTGTNPFSLGPSSSFDNTGAAAGISPAAGTLLLLSSVAVAAFW